MTLMQRRDFDLEGAADYLNCSVGDVLYYLDKGLLRLAALTDHLSEVYAVLFADLSAELQEELKSLYNPDGIDLSQIKISADAKVIEPFPSSIYITHFQRNKVKDTVHELGEPIWIFQDLEGEELTIWTDKSPRAVWFYEEDGWIVDTYLAKAELDRLQYSESEEVAADTSSDAILSQYEPFKAPKRVDEVAEAMVAYGNLFFKEEGRVPTSLDLQAFMLERGGKALQLTYDPKGEDFIFTFKPVSKRQFNERYNQYLVVEKTE